MPPIATPTPVVNSLASLTSDHLPTYDPCASGREAPAQAPATAEPLPTLQTETILVSPALAARWLADRHPNRRLKPPRVAELAQLMRHGQWHLNGEPLIFARDGRLIDGQNRLAALIEAGLTLPFLVVRGVDLAVQPTLGQGVRRTAGDILAMHGHADPRALAAALSWIWRYEHKTMLTKPAYANQDVLTVLDRYPGVEASVSWGTSVRKFLPGSVAAMLHFVMHQQEPALAKTFFKRLHDGLELTERDPIYGLRERCQEARTRQPKPPAWVYAHWAIQCWNALRLGRGAPQLLWSPEVEEARFPEVL